MLSHPLVSECFNPVDCRPPGSSVPGILQARILEWVAISSSRFLLYSKVIQLNRIDQKFLLGFSITSYVYMHTFFFFSLDCIFYKDWVRVGENHK